MKTVITNGQITIVINTNDSILSNYRKAAVEGFTGGQTSFRNLMNGKVQSVKGFELKEIETEAKKASKAARANLNASREVGIQMVTEVKSDINIVAAERQVYATTRTSVGRAQLDPKADGTFRVAMYESKGHTQDDLLAHFKKFGIEAEKKSQYVQAFKVTAAQAKQLINA